MNRNTAAEPEMMKIMIDGNEVLTRYPEHLLGLMLKKYSSKAVVSKFKKASSPKKKEVVLKEGEIKIDPKKLRYARVRDKHVEVKYPVKGGLATLRTFFDTAHKAYAVIGLIKTKGKINPKNWYMPEGWVQP